MEDLEEFVRRENLRIFRRQLGLAKDDARRQWFLERLAEAEGSVATGWVTAGAPPKNS